MNMIVLELPIEMRSNSSWSVIRVCASTAANGSSIRITLGFAAQVRATATRCFIPPESSCGYLSSNPDKPIRSTK